MLFKNYWSSIGCWWACAYLSLIFTKAQYLQIVLKATQTRDVLIFFLKKKFCLISGLKFTFSNITSFPNNLSGLKRKLYSGLYKALNKRRWSPVNNQRESETWRKTSLRTFKLSQSQEWFSVNLKNPENLISYNSWFREYHFSFEFQ